MSGGYPSRWPDRKVHHWGSGNIVEVALDIVGLGFIHCIPSLFPVGMNGCFGYLFAFPQSGTSGYNGSRL